MIKLLNNLKMRAKFISLTTFLALFIGVVGYIGLNNMNKILMLEQH
ncbi:hypothetical protein NNC19_14605 [Clostridium sp. SHJSY1]|nr:hypothetical protein [Clostridium sp. SHJSY1]MDS0526920.1 hypothetical protein [Clostridium sp. SHJSY1]